MAKASRKKMGAGAQGKHAGAGAMTDVDIGKIPDAGVLSNRDKSQHEKERGLDGKDVKSEELRDHGMNRIDDGKV